METISAVDDEVRCLLHQIADKWTVLIIGPLEQGPQRFTALRRGIGDVSQKMLTQTLRGLERNGLVQRTVFAQVPPPAGVRLDAARSDAV